MLGISAGLDSKTVWPHVFFSLRSFISSMAENVHCRLAGGGGRGGGGGGGGGGGRLPQGRGEGGAPMVVAANVTQKKEEKRKKIEYTPCDTLLPSRGKSPLLQLNMKRKIRDYTVI